MQIVWIQINFIAAWQAQHYFGLEANDIMHDTNEAVICDGSR